MQFLPEEHNPFCFAEPESAMHYVARRIFEPGVRRKLTAPDT